MEISQLRAVLALEDLASLVRAGEQLHLSPSAVFCQIRQLEDEVGQKLYDRAGKKLHLTGTGELLARHARKIVAAHDTALLAVREQSATRKDLLRIGCGPHASVRIAPFLLGAFAARYPRSELRLVTFDDGSLLREARGGLLDAVLMTLPVHDKELQEEPLWSYEIVFVLPPARKAGRGAAGLQELKRLPFILYRRSGVIDQALRETFKALGFAPNVMMENDDVDSIKEMVRLGFGSTLLPLWSVGDDAEKGRLRILRPPRTKFYNFGLLYRKAEYRPRVLTRFQEVAHLWQDWWPHATHVAASLT